MSGSDIIENTISRASELVDKHPQAIVSTVVVITLLAIGGASQISTSFTLDDFLSDDLEIMVTGENIQSEFRGASYSQSQILIEGNVASTNFIDGLHEFKEGKPGCNPNISNCGLNDDRFIIQVGSEARVESVHEVVQEAVDSEEYNVVKGQDTTHKWIITNLFAVVPEDTLEVAWNSTSPSLEITIFWYDKNDEEIGEQILHSPQDSEFSSDSSVSTIVPEDAKKSYIKFCKRIISS